MAVITSASSGNFSAPATWVGGVVPTSVDDAVAATTHVVTIDVDVTVLSFQQAGTGKFVLGDGRTITGNVIANAGTFTSGGTIEVTATTTATINGNISGPSTTAASIGCVVMTGTGSLIINGSVTSSVGNASSLANANAMVYSSVTCTIIVNGDVNGSSGLFKRAIWTTSTSNANVTVISAGSMTTGQQGSQAVRHEGATGTVSVTATLITCYEASASVIQLVGASSVLNLTATTIRGGGSTGSTPISCAGNNSMNVVANLIEAGTGNSASAITHTGSSAVITITAVLAVGFASNHAIINFGANSTMNFTGHAKAVGTLGHAIRSDATTNGVIFQGDLTDSNAGAVAIWTRLFRITATANGVTKYASGPNNPFGTLVSRVDPSNSAGMPAISNVRSGTTYGTSNEFTGTVAVPTASQVMYGVPVDGSTGTAEFDLTTVADIVREQVYAGAYERTTL